MKSKELHRNPKTGILVGECICKTCEYRNGRNFLSCLKRTSISNDIILGKENCNHYRKEK